uniref:Carboxyl ester lipase n=1 Tax=Ursus maritimus TaxID=29073 RepID=A0A452UL26_URSMA
MMLEHTMGHLGLVVLGLTCCWAVVSAAKIPRCTIWAFSLLSMETSSPMTPSTCTPTRPTLTTWQPDVTMSTVGEGGAPRGGHVPQVMKLQS